VIEDEFFGRVATYRGRSSSGCRSPPAAGRQRLLEVDSQGCADAGVCYPPQQQRLTLRCPRAGAAPSAPVDASPSKKLYFN
jgi:thiol:disulfide interchange protein DsbD